MEKQEQRVCLQAISKRYCRSGKANKQKTPDEFCVVCGYTRKYALRLLNRKQDSPSLSRKRPGNTMHFRSWNCCVVSSLPAANCAGNASNSH